MDEGENPNGIPPSVLRTVIDEHLQQERRDIDRTSLIYGLELIETGFLLQVVAVAGELFL